MVYKVTWLLHCITLMLMPVLPLLLLTFPTLTTINFVINFIKYGQFIKCCIFSRSFGLSSMCLRGQSSTEDVLNLFVLWIVLKEISTGLNLSQFSINLKFLLIHFDSSRYSGSTISRFYWQVLLSVTDSKTMQHQWFILVSFTELPFSLLNNLVIFLVNNESVIF